MALLNQPRFEPIPILNQVFVVFAGEQCIRCLQTAGFLTLIVDDFQFHAISLGLDGGTHDNVRTACARNGALDEEELTVGVDTNHNQVLGRTLNITEVTRHALTRENATRILRHTDRTRHVVRTAVTVRRALRGHVVALDRAGVALTDRGALHIDLLACCEHGVGGNHATGLMLRAMRDSNTAAASLSIDLQGLRTRVFVVCALFGSLAGSLFAHHVSFVSTQSFTVDRSISFLLIPVIGGATSIPGIVAGAVFVTFLPEFLSNLGDIHQILFGLALVAVVVMLPDGLMGALNRIRARYAARGNRNAD